jgi:hypothetical protein
MRRYLTVGLAAVASVGIALAACSDDATESGTTRDGGSDASVPDTSRPDTSVADTSVADTSVADTSVADADAGPTITTTVGTTGRIHVFGDAVFADFHEDDTIVRASNAPECVAHVASASKPFSNVGKITIGGTIVGSDGGAPTAVEVTADPTMENAYAYFGEVFGANDTLTVQVATAGTIYIPALALQTLKPPAAAAVTVTAPTKPAPVGMIPGRLTIPSTQPFEIKWTVPGGNVADKRIVFAFSGITGTPPLKNVALFCGYPLAQASATIPANVLADLKSRAGTGANGQVHIWVGGQKEVSAGGASYVIEVTRNDTTTLHLPGGEEIQTDLN